MEELNGGASPRNDADSACRRRYFTDNPVPMAEVELDRRRGRCTAFNPNAALVRLLGAGSVEELQSCLGELAPEGLPTELLEPTTRLLEQGGQQSAEISLSSLDGRPLRIRLQAVPDGAAADTVLLTATEVSDDTTVREQLNLLSLLPETNPNMVFVLENGSRVSYVNPAARRWLRDQASEPLEGLLRLLAGYRVDSSAEGATDAGDRLVQTAEDGRRYSIRVASIAGTLRQMITVTDVTEEHRLRLQHDVFETAFETATNPMLITDDQYRIEYVNPAFTRYYGYTAEEARGLNPRILNPGKEAYRDLGFPRESYDALFSRLWSELKENGHYEADLANLRADGSIRWMRAVLTRIVLSEDSPPKYLGVHIDVDETRRHEEAARLEILQTIARVGELRDNETGRHMRRVGLYARRLAETLQMPARYCMDMESYAPLHDIGKVGISDEILLAPRRLTSEEFELIKRHTTLGHGILVEAPSMQMAADIALGHHERFDGGGYPHGRADDAIPMSARIVALVDVYDALRGKRPYKERWDHRTAREEILSGKGSHFCPEVVDAFEKIEAEFEEISVFHAD